LGVEFAYDARGVLQAIRSPVGRFAFSTSSSRRIGM